MNIKFFCLVVLLCGVMKGTGNSSVDLNNYTPPQYYGQEATIEATMRPTLAQAGGFFVLPASEIDIINKDGTKYRCTKDER